ncbi:MAG: gliding-motility protein MglA [Candidatus Fermentibacteraceae bacterium]
MPHLDLDERQVVFKIVYYGPGLSGKTTNLRFIHRTLAERYRGDMLELDTEEERTLFFDFFPVSLGDVEGFSLRFHLYTIPGQVFYEASRRIILQGADGIVFVADSQTDRLEDNLESFRMMQANLASFGYDSEGFPMVLQYNKRDMSPLLSPGTIESELELDPGLPVTESVATRGRGVMNTLKIVSKEVIRHFRLD